MKLASLFISLAWMLIVPFNTNAQSPKKYIYYLHGRIIEIQGKNAVSNDYGTYELDSIINAFSDSKHTIIAEVRNENVIYLEYANKVSKKINSLVNMGVKPINITVIGASKGAIIASHVSSIMHLRPLRYFCRKKL